jgi:hypothetical protein
VNPILRALGTARIAGIQAAVIVVVAELLAGLIAVAAVEALDLVVQVGARARERVVAPSN